MVMRITLEEAIGGGVGFEFYLVVENLRRMKRERERGLVYIVVGERLRGSSGSCPNLQTGQCERQQFQPAGSVVRVRQLLLLFLVVFFF